MQNTTGQNGAQAGNDGGSGGGGSVSHVVQPGELMSQAEWRDTANVITRAIGEHEDDAVARVRLPAEKAAAIVEMLS